MMERPPNIELPFFAYGLFRPGQLAFFQLRDGLPILDPHGRKCVSGALMTFLPERASDAYDRISAMEPDKHYRWHEGKVDGQAANVLVGRSPRRGSVPCEETEWNGWNDPLFTVALDVVEETLESQVFDLNLNPLFRLQMAYLLLWSSIERYVSLRYHLGDKVTEKVGQLAHESAFAQSLGRHVKARREVYRADRPRDKEVLDPGSPDKAVRYYYQARSNITHRGKGVGRDHELLENSLQELLPIFREVLKTAEAEARFSA